MDKKRRVNMFEKLPAHTLITTTFFTLLFTALGLMHIWTPDYINFEVLKELAGKSAMTYVLIMVAGSIIHTMGMALSRKQNPNQ